MIRNGRIWIEVTNREGFLLFGDLAERQGKKGTVDLVCSNCTHKRNFGTKEVEEDVVGFGKKKIKVWDLTPWRVFLRGNQVSRGEIVNYTKLRVEFFCRCCQGDLPSQR